MMGGDGGLKRRFSVSGEAVKSSSDGDNDETKTKRRPGGKDIRLSPV